MKKKIVGGLLAILMLIYCYWGVSQLLNTFTNLVRLAPPTMHNLSQYMLLSIWLGVGVAVIAISIIIALCLIVKLLK